MAEFYPKRYETTPEGLHSRLEDLCTNYLPYAAVSPFSKFASMLILETNNGERILIDKIVSDKQPKTHFVQDICMTVLSYEIESLSSQQVDYNYNQFGDGLWRKRIIKSFYESQFGLLLGNQPADLAKSAKNILRSALDDVENLQLEHRMGLNNQPVTPDDIAQAMSYLDGAWIIDPETRHPVGIVDFND